jgi:hypothetical protein
VGAELLPQPLVPALPQQVLVELTDGRQEAVGVVDGEAAGGVGHLQPVGGRDRGAVERALEQPGRVDLVELDPLVIDQRDHGGGRGPERAHHHLAVLHVGAEQPVRVVVLAADQPLDLVGPAGHGVTSSSRRMPPSGICSHAGRCLASYMTS